jgi:hypothetical protein
MAGAGLPPRHLDWADVIALTKDAAEVSGIRYVMEAYKEEAERILDS